MSATMVTLSALATGLASVGALLAYPLASVPGMAELSKPVHPQRKTWFARFREWMRGQRKVADLADLDDRLLRDIGLTRGVMLSESFRHAPRRSSPSEFDYPQLRRH
ncbi:MAG: DUF1127 domain-containing protein [Rhizobiales bacterium]|nr:DUF1127 domain-containing protein [Hyphomicrobiales bacterium]